jgi:hypothetical protein
VVNAYSTHGREVECVKGTWLRTENRTLSLKGSSLVICVSTVWEWTVPGFSLSDILIVMQTCIISAATVPKQAVAQQWSIPRCQRECVFTEPLSSNCLFRHNMGEYLLRHETCASFLSKTFI